MRRRFARAFLVTAFAICAGHFAWSIWLGPVVASKYRLTASTALTSPTDAKVQLYLRRQLFLPRRPRQAWIELIGHDLIQVFVNGRRIGQNEVQGFPVGLVADLTTYLDPGLNTIAIATKDKTTSGRQPVIAVKGACLLDEKQGERPLWNDQAWRCSTTFEHGTGG